MERERLIRVLSQDIEHLSRFHPQYQILRTKSFMDLRNNISTSVRDHSVNVREELDPYVYSLYRRYFD